MFLDEIHSPANHLPCNAFTAAMAAAIEGHLTYTLPCNTEAYSLLEAGRFPTLSILIDFL